MRTTRSMLAAWVGASAALLSLFAAWSIGRAPSAASADRVPHRAEDEPQPLEPIYAVPESADDRREPPAATTAPAVDPDGPAARPEVQLRGELLAIDARGQEQPPGDGELELHVWMPSAQEAALDLEDGNSGLRQRLRDRQVMTVQVRKGRWEASVPVGASQRFARGRLGDRPLFDLQATQLERSAASAGEVRVTGRVLDPARLRVLDRPSQRDLDSVWIVRLERGDARMHPGRLASTSSAQASPLEIPLSGSEPESWLIGAQGHAWQRIEWDPLSDDERSIELEPGGSLAIDLLTQERREERVVALTLPGSAQPYVELPASGELPITLDGVAPGEFSVALVPAAPQVRSEVPLIAQATVLVRAGEVGSVVLSERTTDRPPTVELRGTLRMSLDWSAGGPHLLVRAQGPTAYWHMDTGGLLPGVSVEREGDAWDFHSDSAVAGGRYVLLECRTGFRSELAVSAAGASSFEIEIPDPLALEVEIVDAASGEPIGASALSWSAGTSSQAAPAATSTLPVEPSNAAGQFRLRVPKYDRVELEARADGYVSARTDLLASAQQSGKIRIPLERR